MLSKKKTKKKINDGYVLKSEVQLIIQNYIRGIQMNDYGSDEGIPQLYSVMKQIEQMPVNFSIFDFNSIPEEELNGIINKFNSIPLNNISGSR